MPMLITRFHRLIQNKFIWIAFSVLVVLSFVFWGTQTVSVDEYNRQFAAGTLSGESVSREAYNDAKFSAYLSLLLNSGSMIPYTSRIDEEIRPMAWRRLASLRVAQQLGLTAGDSEVFHAILREPTFQTENAFDQAKYEQFLTQRLSGLLDGRLSKQRFERHIREELTLGKLRMMLRQTVLVPPLVVRRAYHQIHDQHKVLIAEVDGAPLEDDIEVSEEDARGYFEANPDVFRLPERRVVAYACVDVSSQMDQVEVDEADIQAYYQEHLDEYAINDPAPDASDDDMDDLTLDPAGSPNAAGEISDDVAEPTQEPSDQTEEIVVELTEEAIDLGGELEQPTPTTVPPPARTATHRPLAEVRDEIAATLRREAARVSALDLANELVYDLQPDPYGRAPSFEELLEKYQLPRLETEPFTRDQRDVTGVPDEVVDDFISQAFLLYDTPDEYYSNPIVGDDVVCVAALRAILEPSVPPFEEVRDGALAAAQEQAGQDALAERAQEVRAAIEEAAASGNDIRETLAGLDIEVEETGYFDMQEGLEEQDYASELRQAVAGLNVGETTDPMTAGEDRIIAYVLDRKPADEEGFLPFQDAYEREVGALYASTLMRDWQDQLLADAGFVDHFAPVDDEEPAEMER